MSTAASTSAGGITYCGPPTDALNGAAAADVKALVQGREKEVLTALGIVWRPGARQHIHCPFPDHEDKHPSWRWDDNDRRWYCSCQAGNGDVFDAVVRMGAAHDFKSASRFVDGLLGASPPTPRRAERDRRNLTRTEPVLSEFRHSKLGVPSAAWAYRDRFGDILEMRARYDIEGGAKTVLPWTMKDGTWLNQQMSEVRPLYRLNKLANDRTSPVLFVEGEKAAEAAAALFLDFSATTSSGGCKGHQRVDYTPLKGRDIRDLAR